MKRIKLTFTHDERTLAFVLWKQRAGFSDIGRIFEAKPGSVFTILGEDGCIKPRAWHRNISYLNLSKR